MSTELENKLAKVNAQIEERRKLFMEDVTAYCKANNLTRVDLCNILGIKNTYFDNLKKCSSSVSGKYLSIFKNIISRPLADVDQTVLVRKRASLKSSLWKLERKVKKANAVKPATVAKEEPISKFRPLRKNQLVENTIEARMNGDFRC